MNKSNNLKIKDIQRNTAAYQFSKDSVESGRNNLKQKPATSMQHRSKAYPKNSQRQHEDLSGWRIQESVDLSNPDMFPKSKRKVDKITRQLQKAQPP